MFVLILPVTDIAFPDIEVVMNIIGSAATRLKARLDLIYEIREDGDGRVFSGLHETLLPLSSMSRSVFQQLRGSRTKRSKRPKGANVNPAGAAASMKISGQVGGQVTGVDLRHLLLLLPFLLFDLLDKEIEDYNESHGTTLVNPAHRLIKLVLALLEWYHLLRRTGKTMIDLARLDMLGKVFVDMCAIVFCMRKCGNLLYLCCEKVHSVLHSASEIMRWGDLINTSGEAPEQSHKINVKAPGKNLNHRSSDGKTLLGHARKKLCAQMLGSAIQGI
jgi:hypothetical protein